MNTDKGAQIKRMEKTAIEKRGRQEKLENLDIVERWGAASSAPTFVLTVARDEIEPINIRGGGRCWRICRLRAMAGE